MSVIVKQFQTVRFIQMMSLPFGLFTQVSGSGPLGPLVFLYDGWQLYHKKMKKIETEIKEHQCYRTIFCLPL